MPTSLKRPRRQSREKCVEALAACVRTLCGFSLIDVAGTIRDALKVDERIRDHFDEHAVEVLKEGLGHEPPNTEEDS